VPHRWLSWSTIDRPRPEVECCAFTCTGRRVERAHWRRVVRRRPCPGGSGRRGGRARTRALAQHCRDPARG
jgi:hypothetical protein